MCAERRNTAAEREGRERTGSTRASEMAPVRLTRRYCRPAAAAASVRTHTHTAARPARRLHAHTHTHRERERERETGTGHFPERERGGGRPAGRPFIGRGTSGAPGHWLASGPPPSPPPPKSFSLLLPLPLLPSSSSSSSSSSYRFFDTFPHGGQADTCIAGHHHHQPRVGWWAFA